DEKKVEEIVPLPSYNKNRNARVQPVKSRYKKEPFNTNNREVYCMKKTTEKIAFDYDLLGPVQNQKKNAPRKYGNKNLAIKNTSQKVQVRREKLKASTIYQTLSKIEGPDRISKEKMTSIGLILRDPEIRPTNNDLKEKRTRIDAKEDKYKKEINEQVLTLNVVNSYLGELKNSDNNDDNETWYPCNEEIPKDWLDPNDCEKLPTTFVEVELGAIEKLDEANNSIQKLANNNKICKKIECSNQAEEVQIGQNNYQPYRISIEQNKHWASTK
ncbi:33185_t:CDS:2, partial [Gigaspora margarita]